MDSHRDTLVDSFQSGTFIQTVYALSQEKSGDMQTLASNITALHNEGSIDVIAGFGSLRNRPESNVEFFLARDVFENALPQINAGVRSVMVCVHQLQKEAGQDMAAGTVFDAFILFCEKEPSRPKEALKEIEYNHDFLNFLTPTIIAGSRLDLQYYLTEVLRLIAHNKIEVRRNAVFALGRVHWPVGKIPPEVTYTAIENAMLHERDDEFFGCAIKTSFSLLQRDIRQEGRVAELIESALSKGDDYALHAASELFGFHTKELSDYMLERLIPQLLRVKPANKGSINNIDFGIARLLKTDKATKAIEFLQHFLIAHADETSLEAFNSVVRQIRQNEVLMSKIATRWFLGGERILCEGVRTVVGATHGANMLLEIDPAELCLTNAGHIIFVARKAIGYLFFNPVSAASLIISLMHQAPDEQTLSELSSLMFDPVLLNFTGKAREYVVQRAAVESTPVKEELDRVLEAVDDYLKNLQSVGHIPELHPGEAQREGYNRRFDRQMAGALKEAEAKSVFLGLVSKQVVLYGRGSINYVYGADGQASRQEVTLQEHSVEIEVPRQANLDPLGLEYMLRVFRAELLHT